MRIGETRKVEIGVPAPPPRRDIPAPPPPPQRRPVQVPEKEKVGAGVLQPVSGYSVVSVASGCPQCGKDLEYISLEDGTTLVRCPEHGTLGGIQ